MHVLQKLRDKGITFELAGENIICRPKSMLTDEYRQMILAHKEEIIRELQRQGPPYPNGLGLVKCWYCLKLSGSGVCQVSREKVLGTALLRECAHFQTHPVHQGKVQWKSFLTTGSSFLGTVRNRSLGRRGEQLRNGYFLS